MVKMNGSELTAELTAQELEELEAAERLPVCYDDDSPEMTPEMLSQFRRVGDADRTKQTVSIRLSPETLRIARGYGKGYTSFLSRLLDIAIRDEQLVRKCI